MLDLLLRRKAEILRYDVRETLDEALRRPTPLDTLFALSDARDALEQLAASNWNGRRAHSLISNTEQLLRSWDKAA